MNYDNPFQIGDVCRLRGRDDEWLVVIGRVRSLGPNDCEVLCTYRDRWGSVVVRGSDLCGPLFTIFDR